MLLRAHKTKIHQCFPFYLWCTIACEVHKASKNQDVGKVKAKRTSEVIQKTNKGCIEV